jgi:hypothetical protein
MRAGMRSITVVMSRLYFTRTSMSIRERAISLLTTPNAGPQRIDKKLIFKTQIKMDGRRISALSRE